MLRSHRRILPSQRALIREFDKSRIGLTETFCFMVLSSQGEENIGFTTIDHSN